MPKPRRERIVCPCYKLSRLKLWRLASRSANTLAFCRYSRPANASLPTRSCFYHSSHLFIYFIIPLADNIKELLPISPVVGIFPAKLAASETIVKFCLWSCDCEQSSFSSEKRILHTQFVFMSFLAACGSRKYPSTGWIASKGGKKETVKRMQREFIHYAERKFLQRS